MDCREVSARVWVHSDSVGRVVRHIRTCFSPLQVTDGCWGSSSFALVDKLGHIIARCIGFPKDSRWEQICRGACEAMDRARAAMASPQRDPNGRRGFFWTLFTGFSMGGGQKVRHYS